MDTHNNIRLGVDIGGTFTDVVIRVNDRLVSTKVLTTHDAPEQAILDGIGQVCQKAGISAGQIGGVVHGTTLATNALIERRGAHTALITTNGFRDVIEMRTESRFEQYDLNITLPEPLIAREHRYVVDGRIGADGQELLALDNTALQQVIGRIAEGQYASVAVGLIHSYANNDHELRVRDALTKVLPDIDISLSSEVSPQMREYERFNTVCANAYVKPLMRGYLHRLVERLQAIGVTCPVFLMHSGGGIISLENAAQFPVRLVESGPAGGAIFAAGIAAQYRHDRVLSFDMGGTTAKICLIRDQLPKTARVFEVARTYRFKKGSGMPISIPVIDMVEIGAGGGSIASLDSMQQIRVGPRSAGSAPGPACYGRGGNVPTVTDADLVLGRLDPADFAGGSMVLSEQAARDALDRAIGQSLGTSAVNTANGVSEVVDENMANAARVHAVENGEDLARYSMIAFGGAAPLHAARLCEKLGIDRLLIPPGAGVGSAIGFLRAPYSFEATRTTHMPLAGLDPVQVQHLFAGLASEAEQFVRQCDSRAPIAYTYKAYMRYAGQGWEIAVDIPPEAATKPGELVFQQLFEAAYQALFGRIVHGQAIEIASWSVNAATPTESPVATGAPGKPLVMQATAHCDLFNYRSGEFQQAGVFQREKLQPGNAVHGPALIKESETTTIVPDGFTAQLQTDQCLLLIRTAPAAGTNVEEN